MTPTCGNCYFWNARYGGDYGSCGNPKIAGSRQTTAGDTIAFHDEYAPFLSFGKNFGCIHFAAKDAVPFTTWIKHD